MNIVIVGAGNGGLKLIELFCIMKEVDIIAVIDKNMDSPGIHKAKELGIETFDDISEIPKNVHIVVEATGSEKVLEIIKDNVNPSVKIVESDIAEMLMLTVDHQRATSKKLREDLREINNSLTTALDTSRGFVKKTDEMIREVNKITQQIKILGLNANIEAARAGEHGKGFSVVATEVQKMSDTTNHFASEISELLLSLSAENENIANEIKNLDNIAVSQKCN